MVPAQSHILAFLIQDPWVQPFDLLGLEKNKQFHLLTISCYLEVGREIVNTIIVKLSQGCS